MTKATPIESQSSRAEVEAVARGIATAVAPSTGITEVQASLLHAVTRAVTDVDIDYEHLEPLGPEELAVVLADHSAAYRQRIVQHMVLAELVLAPLPPDVAARVTACAVALDVDDDFVGLARRYAQGALGLAWVDLQRSGFLDRWDDARSEPLHTKAALADPFENTGIDPELEDRWRAFFELDEGTLGRTVATMYHDRAFTLPGSRGAASAYLAQHDFVHVLSEYGTAMESELEVFAFVGRADPDPKGFAWLATMIGLFETGHVHAQGPFAANVRERHLHSAGMDVRLADAIRRGKVVCEHYGTDLFTVDYHALADRPIDEVRVTLGIPPKSEAALAAGSPTPFEPGGLSEYQQAAAAKRDAAESSP